MQNRVGQNAVEYQSLFSVGGIHFTMLLLLLVTASSKTTVHTLTECKVCTVCEDSRSTHWTHDYATTMITDHPQHQSTCTIPREESNSPMSYILKRADMHRNKETVDLCYGYYSLTHQQHRTQCLLYMYNWCIIANTHLKVTIRTSHSSYCWSIAKYMSGYSLSILCFLRLCKWNFHFLIFFCCCCLGPCTRILLPFSKARIFLVSANRSALSARCKPLAEAGGERPNGVTRAMSQLAFGSIRRRRPTLALDLGRVADDHDGACGMVDKVIGHAAKNRALHFAETACSRDDHHRCYLIGNLADNFAGLSRCRTQCSRNLHNIQFRRNTR